jgi:hypothetical protein
MQKKNKNVEKYARKERITWLSKVYEVCNRVHGNVVNYAICMQQKETVEKNMQERKENLAKYERKKKNWAKCTIHEVCSGHIMEAY